MPTPKQMEKLTAEAARRRGPAATAPDAPLPAEYWESVLKDPRAGATGAQMRERRLSEIQRHVLRVSCRRRERTVEIQTADAVRLYGGNAVCPPARPPTYSRCLRIRSSGRPVRCRLVSHERLPRFRPGLEKFRTCRESLRPSRRTVLPLGIPEDRRRPIHASTASVSVARLLSKSRSTSSSRYSARCRTPPISTRVPSQQSAATAW